MLLYAVNALKTLLILLLVFYGFRLLFRYIMPWLLRKFARKVEKRMRDQAEAASGQRRGERVNHTKDEVYVKRPQSKGPKSGDDFDGGEYIDFEEVD